MNASPVITTDALATAIDTSTADGGAVGTALDEAELGALDAFWRACNYIAAGMIYLRDNPLLRDPLEAIHVKRRLLGHWARARGSRSCTPISTARSFATTST